MKYILMIIFIMFSFSASAAEYGKASYYWQPQGIACGKGRYNPHGMTAAHMTLPCGSKVRVTNQRNGKSVVVTINDRGPYIKGRIIDMSLASAKILGMTKAGVVPVKVEVLEYGKKKKKKSKKKSKKRYAKKA